MHMIIYLSRGTTLSTKLHVRLAKIRITLRIRTVHHERMLK